MEIMRCQPCQNLTISRLVSLAESGLGSTHDAYDYHTSSRSYYAHHISISALERSAKSGCDLCQLFLHGLEQVTRFSSDPYLRHMFDIRLRIGPLNLPRLSTCRRLDTLVLQAGDYDMGPAAVWFPLSSPAGTTLGRHRIGRNAVDPNLGAKTNFDLAHTWIDECYKEHTECTDHQEVQLPTRLIDVGVATDPAKPVPCLFVPDGRVTGRYAALSHCWGGAIDMLLTSDRLESFQERLPVESLTNNFKDAIHICREIGIRYLWIDSLCILQDARDDWMRESVRMASVYQNAFVTISAISSPGSMHGILGNSALQDNAGECPNCCTNFSDVGLKLSPENNTIVRVHHVKNSDYALESLGDLYMVAPLVKRAWSLQESILSPRILFFGEKQIYWRCFRGFQAADGVDDRIHFPSDVDIHLAKALQGYTDVKRLSTFGTWAIRGDLDDLYELVEEHSRRSLSFPSDKLPAFSGLAERLHASLGGEYLAGLFTADLQQGLLWRPIHQRQKAEAKGDLSYRAPSWSWALTDIPIHFDALKYGVSKAQLNLLESKMEYQNNNNPYGEVKAGCYIIISGLTMRLVFSRQLYEELPRNVPSERRWADWWAEENIKIWWDDPLLTPINGYRLLETSSGGNHKVSIEENEKFFVALDEPPGDSSMPISSELFFPENYLVLMVKSDKDVRNNQQDESYGSAQCLILQKVAQDATVGVSGDEVPVYRRVGYFYIPDVKEAVSWKEKKLKLI